MREENCGEPRRCVLEGVLEECGCGGCGGVADSDSCFLFQPWLTDLRVDWGDRLGDVLYPVTLPARLKDPRSNCRTLVGSPSRSYD